MDPNAPFARTPTSTNLPWRNPSPAEIALRLVGVPVIAPDAVPTPEESRPLSFTEYAVPFVTP